MGKYDWLDDYLSGKTGTVKDFKSEWGWWRWQVGGKMFAATCTPGPEHHTYAGRDLLTLKCEPMLSELLQKQYSDIFPGFYMDKRNWISIALDGSVPKDTLRELCDQSYSLVFTKLTKKLQREISESVEK